MDVVSKRKPIVVVQKLIMDRVAKTIHVIDIIFIQSINLGETKLMYDELMNMLNWV